MKNSKIELNNGMEIPLASKEIFNVLPMGIVLIDANLIIQYINKTGLKILKTELESEIIGKTCQNILCFENYETCPVIEEGKLIYQKECFAKNSQGDKIPIMKTVILITLDNKKLSLEAFIDLTEQEKIKQELEYTNKRLNQNIANYSMTFDLMDKYSRVMTEREVIENYFKLIRMLFAPLNIIYVSIRDNIPSFILTLSETRKDRIQFNDKLELSLDKDIFAEPKDGLSLNFFLENKKLGFLKFENMAFPEYKSQYMNFIEFLEKILALSISNARLYENLKKSEEKFRSIAEQAYMGITILQDNKIMYANEMASIINGYSIEEMYSWNAEKLFSNIHPEDRDIAMKRANRNTDDENSSDLNYRIIHKTGEIRWINVSSKIIDFKGKHSLFNFFIDITEKRIAEEKIKQSAIHWQTTFDAMNSSVFLLDLNHRILQCNKKTYEMLGKTKESEIIGHKCCELLHNTPEPIDWCVTEQMKLSKKTETEIQQMGDDWFEITASPILNDDGTLTGASHIIKNFTKRKKAEENLENFISTASHELRTPVTVLKQSINNLIDFKDNLSEYDKDTLMDTINRNVKLQHDLIEYLLTISRIEAKGIQLNKRNHNLYKTIISVIQQLDARIISKEIKISFNLNEKLQYFGDEKKISQVFRIIIDNAVKYSHRNSNIEINAVNNYKGKYNPKDLDGLMIEFKDFGMGIKNEEIKKLFQRFYRGSNVQEISGTGLGLWIAKELIMAHGGDIYVESEHEKGSTFHVFLPR